MKANELKVAFALERDASGLPAGHRTERRGGRSREQRGDPWRRHPGRRLEMYRDKLAERRQPEDAAIDRRGHEPPTGSAVRSAHAANPHLRDAGARSRGGCVGADGRQDHRDHQRPRRQTDQGATVRATNEAVNARITSTTDDKGRFAMIGVRTGRWVIVAEAPNFLALQGTSDVSSSMMPVLALTLQRDPGPMPGALSKSITDDSRLRKRCATPVAMTTRFRRTSRSSRRIRG